MASLKAEKHVGTHLFGQSQKEPAKDGGSKAPASKTATKKAAPRTQEPKKKGKGGKSAGKH